MTPEEKEIRALFPNVGDDLEITSDRTKKYNCIAWAAGRNNRKWWPVYPGEWPAEVEKDTHLSAFIKVFELQEYRTCSSFEFEDGFEKIALFGKGERVTHAARQVGKGVWTSKLGDLEDVYHKLESLVGNQYGSLLQAMKRPVTKSAEGASQQDAASKPPEGG